MRKEESNIVWHPSLTMSESKSFKSLYNSFIESYIKHSTFKDLTYTTRPGLDYINKSRLSLSNNSSDCLRLKQTIQINDDTVIDNKINDGVYFTTDWLIYYCLTSCSISTIFRTRTNSTIYKNYMKIMEGLVKRGNYFWLLSIGRSCQIKKKGK
jgi:hypothetical protein